MRVDPTLYRRDIKRSKQGETALAKTAHVVMVKPIQDKYGEPGSAGVSVARMRLKCGTPCPDNVLKERRKARKKSERVEARKKHASALAGRGAKSKAGKTRVVRKVDGVKKKV